MARVRAKLTEKQERILIQCQLMGLTTADMVKISNRLRALDAEREFSAKVNEAVQGKTWIKKGRNHYEITDQKGLVYECVMKKEYRDRWTPSEKWTITINHPGTRMKERIHKDQTVHISGDECARICPDGDKRLYRVLKAIQNGRWN